MKWIVYTMCKRGIVSREFNMALKETQFVIISKDHVCKPIQTDIVKCKRFKTESIKPWKLISPQSCFRDGSDVSSS